MLKKLLLGVVTVMTSMGVAFAAVNINTATQAELEALPGVGPAKAKAIIDHRTKNGNFKAIEDIKNVKGIGDKMFDKLKAELSVSGASTAPVAAASAPAKKEAAPAAKK